jgi:SNF2 family DNA or RNA helicase
MDQDNSELLKLYQNLPELSQNVINVLVVKFSGVPKYAVGRFFQDKLENNMTQREYENVLGRLVKNELVTLSESSYDVSFALKISLFHKLIQEDKYVRIIRKIQKEYNPYSYTPVVEYLRDFLFGYWVKADKNSQDAVERLIHSGFEAAPWIKQMLQYPEYDQAFIQSPVFFYEMLENIQIISVLYFQDFLPLAQFFGRNPEFKGIYNQVTFIQAEMLFNLGEIDKADDLIRNVNNTNSLLLKSQIELFRGNFESSILYYEKAQVTDRDGQKMPKMEFALYNEFLYWLNFALNPKMVNPKKLESAISKKTRSKYSDDHFLLPLLYFILKDNTRAQATYRQINTLSCLTTIHFKSLYYLLLGYMINGAVSHDLQKAAQKTGYLLKTANRRLFLHELNYIIEKSDLNIDVLGSEVDRVPDIYPCVMSHLVLQEKWEQLLDGLLNLTGGKPETVKEKSATARVCYLLDMDSGFIQPVLQTMNAKGMWSAGRSIALKRFKEQQVDGMTEQDRKVAASGISYSSGYYGATDYQIDFNKAISELCGHPYLFLYSNPSVSIELVKAQPEIITENTRNGIRLKTNIANANANEKIILIRETQTRYKLIELTSKQMSIIRVINQGVTIPPKGKAKLIETMSNLGGIMTVHSDLEEGSQMLKSIDADARIRVQVVPIGDGLKAELFVKPLGTVPPYLKPGAGSKVVYGSVGGEKCQAIRNMKLENANCEKITEALSSILTDDMTENAVTFSDPYDCLNLLEIIRNNSEIALLEWPEGERFRMKKSASFANLQLRVKGKGQWFNLEGELNVDEETVLSLKELIERSRKSKGRFIELKDGEYLALADELKKHIEELESYVSIDKNGIAINRFATHAIEAITSQVASFKADKQWKDFQKLVKSSSVSEVVVPVTLDAELRPYQEEGFRWMVRLKTWKAGACLADDMGLGKTIQAIAMMLHLAENGPVLVVCPASVVSNWNNELQKFAPALNCVNLKAGNREEVFANLAAFDVLVITYGLLQTEKSRIAQTDWAMAVLDEAHAIKNTQTKSSKAAMDIQAGFKLALTGTPIQNHLGELWNLFNFCNPGLLGTLQQFTDRYVKNDVPAQKNHLKKLITPFILRRTKNNVLDELPPKTEITHSVTLSDQEMAFYEALRRKAIQTLETSEGPNGQQHLQALAEITKLRLACCHTSLVSKEIELPSSKLEALLEIVEELRANRHRALVFSQFVGHLSIVRKELDRREISYQYLDGSTSLFDRQSAVKDFQAGKGELFLISLKAGGLGLNLTAADYVLHLDPWWNPAIEDQASDRAHRIGQTRPVTIYRLVAKNTIEEKILQLHATKRDMADGLLEGTDQSARLSTADLLNLLKEV